MDHDTELIEKRKAEDAELVAALNRRRAREQAEHRERQQAADTAAREAQLLACRTGLEVLDNVEAAIERGRKTCAAIPGGEVRWKQMFSEQIFNMWTLDLAVEGFRRARVKIANRLSQLEDNEPEGPVLNVGAMNLGTPAPKRPENNVMGPAPEETPVPAGGSKRERNARAERASAPK